MQKINTIASAAEVGIFWIAADSTPQLVVSEPIGEAMGIGDGFYTYSFNHSKIWAVMKGKGVLPDEWLTKKHTEVPRGRILYDSAEERYLVLVAPAFVKDNKLKAEVCREFNLPPALTKVSTAPHYNMP